MKNILFLLTAVLFSLIITKAQNIPNGNFESWSLIDKIMQPDSWETNADTSLVLVSEASPGYNSSHACNIIEKNVMGFGVPGSIIQTFAFTGNPNSITGYYKILPQSGDSVAIFIDAVLYLNNNPIASAAFLKGSKTSTGFAQFIADFYYFGKANPDSAIVTVYIQSKNSTENSSVVIDELQFSNISAGINDANKSVSFGNIYPVPAKDNINIPISSLQSQNLNVRIYDLLGTKLNEFQHNNFTGSNINVPVADLANGIYLVSVKSDISEAKVYKFIVAH
jgi:hypothetical protein